MILLHGYGANGLAQNLYFGIGQEVDRLGFLYAYPDGTMDSKANDFGTPPMSAATLTKEHR